MDGRIALRRLRIAFALLSVAALLMFATSRFLRVAAVDHGRGRIEYRVARPSQALATASLVLTAAAAAFAVRSRVPFPGYVLAAGALLLLLVNALLDGTGFAHRVVLERDRIVVPERGFVWTAPHDIRVADISAVWVRTDAPGQRTVVFIPQDDGKPTEAPLGTLLTAALPELKRRLVERGVEVTDDE